MKHWNSKDRSSYYAKHNPLIVGRIDLERQEGAQINCSLLQSGAGGGRGA